MYAIVEVGGRQYRVTEGQTIRVERLPQEVGGKVDLERVLLLEEDDQVEVGTPVVAGAKVQATVTAQGLGPKVRIFHYRPKKRYKKLKGHRQPFSQLLIENITLRGRAAKKAEVPAEKPAKRQPTKKAAAGPRTKKPAARAKAPAKKTTKEATKK